MIAARPWPAAVRQLVDRVFREDLARVEQAIAKGARAASWRSIVRDPAQP